MSRLISKYRYVVYLILSLAFLQCGAADEMGEDVNSNAKESQPAAMAEEEEMSEESTSTYKDEGVLDYKKWNKKAKQQLESIQDLANILHDTSIDFDFKTEIEKELSSIYPNTDTTQFDIKIEELNFKNFKELKIKNSDTLILQFSNKKELLNAEFIVVIETKTFGKTNEMVESLRLISIKKEE